jgi:hypothetical protein
MNTDEKNNLKEGDNQKPVGQDFDQTNEQKHVELTEEQRQERLALSGMLLENKEDLIKARAEREKQKKQEIVELHSGKAFTVGEIERLVSVEPRPYAPMFPYCEPYFKELYRVYYPDRDYKEYPKPYYVSVLFRELIYGRFDKIILPTLDKLNPLVSGKYRARKLFQHLNSTGQAELIDFRDETTKVLEKTGTGDPYGFRKKMYEDHKVPYQLDVFKEKS